MKLLVTDCECCEELTYHLCIEPEQLEYDRDDKKFVVSMTEDEMVDLYFMLKEHKCK